MKKIICIIFGIALLSGCAGMITKWECPDNSCISYERAVNKCLAQANAAFSRNKGGIWRQCMKGEGFVNIPCEPGESRTNDKCQIVHVY
jgi:hypothetical protein